MNTFLNDDVSESAMPKETGTKGSKGKTENQAENINERVHDYKRGQGKHKDSYYDTQLKNYDYRTSETIWSDLDNPYKAREWTARDTWAFEEYPAAITAFLGEYPGRNVIMDIHEHLKYYVNCWEIARFSGKHEKVVYSLDKERQILNLTRRQNLREEAANLDEDTEGTFVVAVAIRKMSPEERKIYAEEDVADGTTELDADPGIQRHAWDRKYIVSTAAKIYLQNEWRSIAMNWEYKNEVPPHAFETDRSMNWDILVRFLSTLQRKWKFYKCICHSYADTGEKWNKTFQSIEELKDPGDMPEHGLFVNAIYLDSYHHYIFNITASSGSNIFEYFQRSEELDETVQKERSYDYLLWHIDYETDNYTTADGIWDDLRSEDKAKNWMSRERWARIEYPAAISAFLDGYPGEDEIKRIYKYMMSGILPGHRRQERENETSQFVLKREDGILELGIGYEYEDEELTGSFFDNYHEVDMVALKTAEIREMNPDERVQYKGIHDADRIFEEFSAGRLWHGAFDFLVLDEKYLITFKSDSHKI